jgi:hypothetical protein
MNCLLTGKTRKFSLSVFLASHQLIKIGRKRKEREKHTQKSGDCSSRLVSQYFNENDCSVVRSGIVYRRGVLSTIYFGSGYRTNWRLSVISLLTMFEWGEIIRFICGAQESSSPCE